MSYAGVGTEQNVAFGSQRIPRTVIRAIPMSMLLVGPTMQIIICINNYDRGLQAVLFPVHSCMLGVMKWTVYFMLLLITVSHCTKFCWDISCTSCFFVIEGTGTSFDDSQKLI